MGILARSINKFKRAEHEFGHNSACISNIGTV